MPSKPHCRYTLINADQFQWLALQSQKSMWYIFRL